MIVIRIGQVRNLTDLFRGRSEARSGFDMQTKWQERITSRVEAIRQIEQELDIQYTENGTMKSEELFVDDADRA